MEIEHINENNDLDPRLQVTFDRLSRQTLQTATNSDSLGEIAVVAVVNDPSVWADRTDFRMIAELGKTRDGQHTIVTARVPASRIPDIRNDKRVVSLKGAQQIPMALKATVPDILATPAVLPTRANSRLGEGVVLGIIDYGCDFAHRNFRNSNGTTRIEALWDQSPGLQAMGDVQYGRVYSKSAIDSALKSKQPYDVLGYDPDPARLGMHGTHVMDIAAGNGAGSGIPGVAPKTTIVFVHLSTNDIPWMGEASLTTKLGDSVHLLEALAWIFQTAGKRPCVVNVSLGTNGGPHDGSTPFEQALDAMVTAAPNRAVVVAAANTHGQKIHAMGAVPNQGSLDLSWMIPKAGGGPKEGAGPNEMEIWYAKDDEFEVELLDETGQSFGKVVRSGSARLKDDNGNTLVFISHRQADPINKDNVIGIFLEGSLKQLIWTVRLHGKKIAKTGEFHAWIERNDNAQTLFKGPLVVDSHTLGSLSCGHESVVVASYDAHYKSNPISYFSSAGPTRDGRNKPEISAPGHDVYAARSATENGLIRMSGTSMAAPAVAGAIAVMLSETLAAGISMDSKKIRDAVIASARLAPPPGGAKWDARYGHGRISALSMLQTALPPVVAAPEPAPAAGAKRARPKGRRPQAKAASNRAAKATRRKALAASKRR